MIPFYWKTWWVSTMLLIILFFALARKIYDMRQKHLQDRRRANYYNTPSREPTQQPLNYFVLGVIPRNDNIPVENPNNNGSEENIAGAGKKLPVNISCESVTVSRERAKEGCSICLEEFEKNKDKDGDDDDDVAILRCDHMFHLHCIVAWTVHKKWCPLCRRGVDRVVVVMMELGFSDIEAQ